MAYWYQAFCYSMYLDVACIVNAGGPAWTGHLATVCSSNVPRGALCTRPIGPGACGKLSLWQCALLVDTLSVCCIEGS